MADPICTDPKAPPGKRLYVVEYLDPEDPYHRGRSVAAAMEHAPKGSVGVCDLREPADPEKPLRPLTALETEGCLVRPERTRDGESLAPEAIRKTLQGEHAERDVCARRTSVDQVFHILSAFADDLDKVRSTTAPGDSVNLSMGISLAIDDLNTLPGLAGISAKNIQANAETVIKALERASQGDPYEVTTISIPGESKLITKGDLQAGLKVRDAIEELAKSGRKVYTVAGNDGPDNFNLLGLMPDSAKENVVVVGAQEGESGVASYSANNSTVDRYESGEMLVWTLRGEPMNPVISKFSKPVSEINAVPGTIEQDVAALAIIPQELTAALASYRGAIFDQSSGRRQLDSELLGIIGESSHKGAVYRASEIVAAVPGALSQVGPNGLAGEYVRVDDRKHAEVAQPVIEMEYGTSVAAPRAAGKDR